MFTYYDVGRQSLEIYLCIKFRLPHFLPLSHTYAIKNVLAKTVFVVFREKHCLHILTMMMFVGSQSFISLPSFVLLSAAVSEIRESNRNKEKNNNFENGYNLITFHACNLTIF